MKYVSYLLMFSLLSLSAACGGDDGTDGSDIDPGKALTELSADEALSLCTATENSLSDNILNDLLCTTTALTLVIIDPSADCEALRQECLSDPELEPLTLDCPTADIGTLPACAASVTVAEMEACLVDTYRGLEDLVSALSCDSSLDDFPANDDLVTLAASCQPLEAACPELFEDVTEPR
ncbi:MAG: hypothetical protein AAGC55_02725 [Myxococcota bacterium]